MKKLSMIVISLAMLIALTGIVMASSSGDTKIDAKVQPLMLTLSAPAHVSDWELIRGINNDKSIGNVIVSTNDGTGVPCYLVVTTDNGGKMYFRTPPNKDSYLQTSLEIMKGSAYVPMETPVNLWSTAALNNTEVTIPIDLRQFVTSTDVAEDYTITLTFTLEQGTLPT